MLGSIYIGTLQTAKLGLSYGLSEQGETLKVTNQDLCIALKSNAKKFSRIGYDRAPSSMIDLREMNCNELPRTLTAWIDHLSFWPYHSNILIHCYPFACPRIMS